MLGSTEFLDDVIDALKSLDDVIFEFNRFNRIDVLLTEAFLGPLKEFSIFFIEVDLRGFWRGRMPGGRGAVAFSLPFFGSPKITLVLIGAVHNNII
jgi:hypothetical protein